MKRNRKTYFKAAFKFKTALPALLQKSKGVLTTSVNIASHRHGYQVQVEDCGEENARVGHWLQVRRQGELGGEKCLLHFCARLQHLRKKEHEFPKFN